MSDQPMGDGWWLASDGKWYAPELRPGVGHDDLTEETPTTGRQGDSTDAADARAIDPRPPALPNPPPPRPPMLVNRGGSDINSVSRGPGDTASGRGRNNALTVVVSLVAILGMAALGIAWWVRASGNSPSTAPVTTVEPPENSAETTDVRSPTTAEFDTTTSTTSTTSAPSTETSTATTTTLVPPPEPPGVERKRMPDVICMDLQTAQNTIQRAGVFFSKSFDATGARRLQIIDRNWIVVSQEPEAGVPIGEFEARLGVVKKGEPNPC